VDPAVLVAGLGPAAAERSRTASITPSERFEQEDDDPMRKSIAAAAATLLTAVAAPALAAPPADQDACNSQAFSLAEKAAAKKLPEADALNVDQLILKLEGQCSAGQLADAEATIKDIEAALAK